MFSFIHAADLHIDSPLVGLEVYEGVPAEEIRQAPRRSLENLVALACERKVDFVVLAGDIYDGEWPDHNTGLFFSRQMRLLRDAGIVVVMIAGNHDAQSKITKSLELPKNVIKLSAAHPETAQHPRLSELGVAIHGQSFATQAVHSNLAREYPSKQPGMYNIGVLHTSLEGAEGHEPYAPCKLGDLLHKGYDYWALGHIHKREILHEDPWIVFSGNIQGRHIRELGAKGCYLVTVDDGRKTNLEFIPLHVMRWELCELSLTGTEVQPQRLLHLLRRRFSELRDHHRSLPLAIRVIVKGETPFHTEYLAHQQKWLNEIRALAMDVFADAAWIEKVKFQTRFPTDKPSNADFSEAWEEIEWCLQEARNDSESKKSLLEALDGLLLKLPDELLTGADGISFDRDDLIDEWLSGAESILFDRLRRGGEA